MSVEVVVPYGGECPHRAAALAWIQDRHREAGWAVTAAVGGAGAWSKARAAMPAIAASRADVVVLADADVWTDGLTAAVDAVRDGAGWAIPHRIVYRLTETATREILAGAAWTLDAETGERPYVGIEGGGAVVARRDVLLEAPLDPRFVGWGQEDMSHAVALRALFGAPWRGTAPLVHLYHPPAGRMTRRRGSRESWALFKRYNAARSDPTMMRALLEEARADLRPAHHSLRASAA